MGNALRNAFFSKRVKALELGQIKLCLTLTLKDSTYTVCGVPDLMYLLYGTELGDLILVVEATLSPSTRHLIYGEMLFYSIAAYIYYGCRVAGLVVNPRHVYLISFRENAVNRFRRLLSNSYLKTHKITKN